MSNKKRSYTEEFKRGAVDLVINESLSVAEVGRRLGTSAKNISRWVQECAVIERDSANQDKELLQRLALLEKENTRLRKEREILKKAAAFFASESN
jgi:transposase